MQFSKTNDCMKPDILCLIETHLNPNEHINIDNYVWIGNNRKSIAIRAPKPSGGIGVLINQTILSQYSFKVVDKQFDGILIIELKNKFTDFVCILCVTCHLKTNSGVETPLDSLHMFYHRFICVLMLI